MLSKYTDKIVLVLMLAVVVMAFGMGAMWSKLQTLGQAPQAPQAPQVKAGKYKSFEEAIGDMAKQAGVKDINKLVSCMNSGEKKTVVDADTSEGTGVGITGTPGFFINGRLLAGAYPFEEFKKIIDEELSGKPDPKAARTPAKIGNAPTKGTLGAPVIVLEYSDFQCPFCARSFPTVQQVLKEYSGRVLFAYKHFPLNSIHPRAQKAAEASECARDQGKFWEFHDQLFEKQSDWAGL